VPRQAAFLLCAAAHARAPPGGAHAARACPTRSAPAARRHGPARPAICVTGKAPNRPANQSPRANRKGSRRSLIWKGTEVGAAVPPAAMARQWPGANSGSGPKEPPYHRSKDPDARSAQYQRAWPTRTQEKEYTGQFHPSSCYHQLINPPPGPRARAADGKESGWCARTEWQRFCARCSSGCCCSARQRGAACLHASPCHAREPVLCCDVMCHDAPPPARAPVRAHGLTH
jgi:hypothetical protein